MKGFNLITSSLQDSIVNQPVPTRLELWEDGFRFLDIKVINVVDFTELLVRFVFNTLLIFVVVHFMYAKNSRRKDFYFSYLSIGVIVFLLSFLLNSVKLELGFALGLFAIFGIIRYRTDAIPIKEMTYLFIVIGISVINALANKKVSYAELIITNSVIIFGLWILEKRLMLKQEGSIRLIYEKIENIHALKSEELLFDLKERTGINIKRYEIQKIDFLKDVAEIILYFNVNGKDKKLSE
ncbi:DUF4956 domain-containing protein [Plebeiibacterium marinum]|uniref:DUF4956 domain-containing protein n=1 Tax=Plebeiibacterium marinum TaxID=2992111 RepID=A0AAE3MC80_9BACT|nr:DUF4956 domain-containing protein [Plebeiobacterium marinum]MCW3804904.1 DUF4956 domain-containing protein [Plebeiobacterium marinum]